MTEELDAQRLVTQGYSPAHYARKVYLIHLTDDENQVLQAVQPTQRSALAERRRTNWQQNGILPLTVFRSLLADWLKDDLLSKRVAVSMAAFKIHPSPPLAIDLGITYAGFAQLQAHPQLLDLFGLHTPAFAKGAFQRAKTHLGDTGASGPEHWAAAYRHDNLHVLLFAHSHRPEADRFHELEFAVHKALGKDLDPDPDPDPKSRILIAPSLGGEPLKGDWIEQSVRLSKDGTKIHFDMVDNITAPKFEGLDDVTEVKSFNKHQLGELLLGYSRNDGTNIWRLPHALHQAIGASSPKPKSERLAYGEFFKNGTFGAFRKMRQDVDTFNDYLAKTATRYMGGWPPNYTVAWLKAKMLGRWPNGEPVTQADGYPTAKPLASFPPERMKAAYLPKANDNEFGFEDDPEGLGCPMGAHIRRANPRNDLVGPFIARPLLRRGTPYDEPGGKDKGLLGLFFCASLEEQFEHVLGAWMNSSPLRLSTHGFVGKDPLVGNQDIYNADFEIPKTSTSKLTLCEIPTFVQTVGTSYAFFPSLAALQKIADNKLGSYKEFVKE